MYVRVSTNPGGDRKNVVASKDLSSIQDKIFLNKAPAFADNVQ